MISTTLPAAVLEVDPALHYAGTQTFELYGVATAEQHFFVELDGTRVKRMLWVQYEGYLPSNTHTYNSGDSTVALSGKTFHRRVRAARLPDSEPRPDSDGAKARAFIEGKGWKIGPDVLMERLLWYLDTPARHEMMLIYFEDPADLGLTAADLNPGGRAADRWSEVTAGFSRRGESVFKIVDR